MLAGGGRGLFGAGGRGGVEAARGGVFLLFSLVLLGSVGGEEAHFQGDLGSVSSEEKPISKLAPAVLPESDLSGDDVLAAGDEDQRGGRRVPTGLVGLVRVGRDGGGGKHVRDMVRLGKRSISLEEEREEAEKRSMDGLRLGRRAMGDTMRLGKRAMGDSLRLGKRAMSDSMRLGKKSIGDSMRLGRRAMGDTMRLGKRGMDTMRLGKRSMGDSMRLGRRAMGDTMRLGKRGMDTMRLGRRAMGDTMRLGKRAMGDSLRLGKKSMGDSLRLGKRAMGDSLRLGKRPMGDALRLGKRAMSDSMRLGKRHHENAADYFDEEDDFEDEIRHLNDLLNFPAADDDEEYLDETSSY